MLAKQNVNPPCCGQVSVGSRMYDDMSAAAASMMTTAATKWCSEMHARYFAMRASRDETLRWSDHRTQCRADAIMPYPITTACWLPFALPARLYLRGHCLAPLASHGLGLLLELTLGQPEPRQLACVEGPFTCPRTAAA